MQLNEADFDLENFHPDFISDDAILAVECEQSLKKFVIEFWDIVEPGTEFVDGFHIDAICLHLQALMEGIFKDLLINMPPRCMKSTLISVMFPCWVWTFKPERRFLSSSYAQSLSTRDSVKCRRIIESPKYQRLFGDRVQLTGDQNTKTKFENTAMGYRIATSVDGATTGEGGDILLIDDAQSATDAFSEAMTRSTLDWWDNTMSSRLNNPKTGCRIIVMQRLADTDLTAHVLRQGGFVHLNLPMEFEADRKCITPIWEDPRTIEGELLWPQRIGPKEVEEYKTRLGSYGYAGQYQQRPSPKGGGMFQRAWFEIVKAAPAKAKRVRYWDRAATVKRQGTDPDYSVGLKMSKDIDGIHYIEDVIRLRESSLKIRDTIKNTATQDGYITKVRLEQEPGASGKSEVETLIRFLSGFNAKPDLVQRDKITRASPFSAYCEAGNVKLVAASWNEEFLRELETFPFGKHDDQVDSASGAYNSLNEPGLNYEDLVKL